MKTKPKEIQQLEIGKGISYGFVYQPLIGIKDPSQYPFAVRFPSILRRPRS